MPSALTYPGVYVEEIPSGVRTITGVPTSVTAFVGRARKGPTNEAFEITSFGDFERVFGGLWASSAMSFAVRDFYLNGGARAVIVRLFGPTYPDAATQAKVEAAAAKVATAAAAAANGKAAKAAAKAVNDATQATTSTASQEEKDAAQAAFNRIDQLDDAADANAVKAVAAAATAPSVRKIAIGPATFAAAYPGRWAAGLRVTIERPYDSKGQPTASAKDAAKALGVDVADLFTLSVNDEGSGGASEVFANVTLAKSTRRIDRVLANESTLISWAGASLETSPPKLSDVVPDAKAGQSDYEPRKGDEVVEARLALQKKKAADPDPTTFTTEQEALDKAAEAARASVTDGDALTAKDFRLASGRNDKTGLYSLEQLFTRGGLFNLLCIPPYANAGEDIGKGVMAAAAALCEQRRAMLIVDPPKVWTSIHVATDHFGNNTEDLPRTKNAAVYFPRIRQPNPLHDDQIEEFAPCGVVAGIYARTDVQRGVWKSPAGLDASLVGVSEMSVPMTDEENGLLNPLGINCLRKFPVFGHVVWGARTLRGADDYGDEYKYVPVRRTALFIEESLYRGLKWVVFEPNDEPLWAQIRLNVGAFLHNLFRQGAFQGASPRDAYFVKVDKSTTTQNDINLGIVNIVVGFAPLKPAEFVVIKLQQIAGQIEA
jgi:phage tail sheath protein FI